MPERAPDPLRPHDVPRGRPFTPFGRPGVAFTLVGLLLAAAVVVLVVFAVR